MDKLKGVAKHGVHPTGNHEIHRNSWKSDVKNIALRKDPNKAHLDQARNHRSAPLSTLKDPDSFGPPPKHTGASGSASSPVVLSSPVAPSPVRQQPRAAPGGWGAPVPAPKRRQEQEQEEEEEAKPAVPYRTDTTGLRTDNLPAPPVRRAVDGDAAPPPAPPPRHALPSSPALPMRTQQQQHPLTDGPAPGLPPRMTEHPDEYTPPAPPPYHEATNAVKQAAPLLNQGALNRLGQAGVSVPGLDIGSSRQDTAAAQSPSTPQGHGGQLSELQQRFARMNAGNSPDSPSTIPPTAALHNVAVAAAAKKPPPPPPPPKKPGLAGTNASRPSTADGSNAPPPLPMSSKPRPS